LLLATTPIDTDAGMAAVLIEGLTPVAAVFALQGSVMFCSDELAPKNSTWLPLAPETCNVVAACRLPPLYVSEPCLAAVITDASIVTEDADPKRARFTEKARSLA